MKKISIIVPIYNVEKYIEECLDSLLAQTLDGLDIILVNDGTKDLSGIIARKYAETYPNLFRYYEKENGGLSDARNFGLKYVQGVYTAFLDSDDYVLPNTYEMLWNNTLCGEAEVVECEYIEFFDECEKKHSIRKLPKRYKDKSEYIIKSRVNAWNKLYRSDILQRYNICFPKGLLFEDVFFYFQLIPQLERKIVTVHEGLIMYRQRSGSIMNNTTKRIMEIHTIFEKIFDYYKCNSVSKEYLIALEYKYARTILSRFLFMIFKIEDKSMRDVMLNETWSRLNKNCPNWKKNPNMHRCTIRNLYLKLVNPKIIGMMEFFFCKVRK